MLSQIRSLLVAGLKYMNQHIIYLPGILLCVVVVCLLVLLLLGKHRRAAMVTQLQARAGSVRRQRAGRIFLVVLTALCWAGIGILLFYVQCVSVWAFLKFIGFFLVYLVLPGYFAVRRMDRLVSLSALLALSTVVGMCLLTAVYLLASLCGFMPLVLFVSPAICAVSVVLLVRDCQKKRPVTGLFRIDLPLLAVGSLLLFYAVTVRGSAGISPQVSGSVTNFMDALYIITNSAALKGGLMAESLNFPGFVLRYHVATNILQACAGLVTGISAVDIFMTFWPFLYISTAVCAVHGLMCQYRRQTRYATLMTLLVFFSETFTFALFHLFNRAEILRTVYLGTGNLEAYLLTLPNGNDIAIAAVLCAVLVVLMAYRDECRFVSALVLLFAFSGLTTAAKAPYGICLCAALGGTFLLVPLQRQGRGHLKKPFWLFAVGLLGFAAAYFCFLYNPSQAGASTASFLAFGDTRSSLKLDATYQWVSALLSGWFPHAVIPEWVVLLVEFPLSLFNVLPYVMIPFFAFFVGRLKQFRQTAAEDMVLCGMGISALLGYYLVNFDGYSQIYFLLAGICFLHLLGQTWLERNAPRFPFLLKSLTALLLAVSLFGTLVNMSIRLEGSLGTYAHAHAAQKYSYDVPEPSADSLTAYEYDGMIWLRDHTPVDATVVCDRFFTRDLDGRSRLEAIDDALYFYYAAYSERQMFLSGFSYSPRTPEMAAWLEKRFHVIDALYRDGTADRAQIMRGNGISFMVVSRLMTPDLDVSEDSSLACVFENRDIAIYGIAR